MAAARAAPGAHSGPFQVGDAVYCYFRSALYAAKVPWRRHALRVCGDENG